MKARTAFRWLLALGFIAAGLNHFRDHAVYAGLMPPGLPWPDALIYLSGSAEILGGLGVMIPLMRRAAGWGLLALLAAVFPANLHVALLGHMPGLAVPAWGLWVRLPFQLVFMAWVWWVALAPPRDETLD